MPERRPQPSTVIKMIIIMIITEMRRFEKVPVASESIRFYISTYSARFTLVQMFLARAVDARQVALSTAISLPIN